MTHGLLKDKKGIIFGALDESSIAWKVAEKAYSEGATFLLTNAPVAMRLGNIKKLAQQCNTEVVPADATNLDDLRKLMETAKEKFGKIDFMLHSIGMSPNIRKNKPYNDLDYEFYNKTLDVSAISLHKMLHVAEKADILNRNASIVALTYIAAQRVFSKYSDMADAKALLESITRSYGYRLGTSLGVRVNTVSQSPTKTTAGSGIAGFEEMFNYAEKMSPLGNATADDCADFCIVLFSDYTRKVTMQNIYHDGGFSMVGISDAIIQEYILNKK
ncbi:MAG: enoyl-ACP reductase [Bacteroidia bacterium]|nr:enoyl-ACP reductase [Bacteroidia bacterium]MDW8345763.1 enoyl-ACP reductase [Bacteroidia bacterium]